jgi:hypothetical protein
MKPYNRENWWIDSDIIKPIEVEAKNLKEALNQYVKEVADTAYIEISKSALKNRKKMFRDFPVGTKQVGYVITGKTEFQKDDYSWVEQFIEIWVEVIGVEYKPLF